MTKESEDFIREGMARYKPAAATLVRFGRAVQAVLQEVLSARRKSSLGSFIPSKSPFPRSTTYWSEYPLLNAKLDGELWGTSTKLTIAVNWFQAEGDYPLYHLALEPSEPFAEKMRSFAWGAGVNYSNGRLELFPDRDNFNLERDFGVLLDEMTRFLSAKTEPIP